MASSDSDPVVSPEQVLRFVRARMSLRHLRVLRAVAEHGSVSLAAEALHVTQPAVSKTLAEIEAGIGQPVLVRGGRHLRISRIGMRIVEMARRVDADLARGGAELRSLVHGASGEVIVGTSNEALVDLLPAAIAEVKARNPQLKLTVLTSSPFKLFASLRQAQVDLVVARVRDDEQFTDLQGVELMPSRERIVASRLHATSLLERAGWDTLNQLAWVLPAADTRTRALVERFWANKGLAPPANVIETSDIAFTGALMRHLPVLAFASETVALRFAADGLAAVLPHPVRLGLSALNRWTLPGPQTPVVDEFCTALDRAARSLACIAEASRGRMQDGAA